MNYSHRVEALQRALPGLKCDALVVSNLTNVRYLCGFTGTSGMVVVLKDETHFITDFRYRSQAAQQIPPFFTTVIGEVGLWKKACELLKDKFKRRRAARLGFEAEHVSVATFEEITELLKPITPVSTKGVVEDLRMRKDADEIKIIRRAVAVADASFEYICGVLKPGMTEIEVADELERAMKARGASGPSFSTIVASGKRSALPHGIASKKKLAKGDLVTIDMGALVDGYCSDMTRTVCLGKPTSRQQEIYELVWQAQTTAATSLRPGLGCVDADSIARKIIEDAGYGDQFGHGLGHAVGLNIHEQPRLSKLGQGNLEPGMVMTCEPGIYIEGWGGVRIEDMIVITEDGAQILTRSPKPREIIAL
ncbi:MAG: aminopeptidase P family protein [Armatimonadota bacterium]|nr:aminopeptidase P family protein [Armatimonadota bacterium]